MTWQQILVLIIYHLLVTLFILCFQKYRYNLNLKEEREFYQAWKEKEQAQDKNFKEALLSLRKTEVEDKAIQVPVKTSKVKK